MVKNKYKVNKKQWSKWSNDSKFIYNYINDYRTMQNIINCHPNTKQVNNKTWTTIIHNIAFLAACCNDTIIARKEKVMLSMGEPIGRIKKYC